MHLLQTGLFYSSMVLAGYQEHLSSNLLAKPRVVNCQVKNVNISSNIV